MTERHTGPDELLRLALQETPPDERTRLAAHLTGCDRCAAEYAELELDVQRAVAAAPSIAPPAGFSGRVLDAMGIEELPARRPARRWAPVAAVAAALLVGLALGVGGAATFLRTEGPPQAAPSAGPVSTAAALRTASGETVGTVGFTQLAGTPHLLISIAAAPPDLTYDCIVIDAEGQRFDGGTWTLSADVGKTTASGSWVVEIASPPERVEMVTPSGYVWATAEF